MPAPSPIQTSFAAGELSPRLRGRVDSALYKAGLATCENWNPTPQGSMMKREGSYAIARQTTAGGFIRSLSFKAADLSVFQVVLSDQRLEVFNASGVFGAFASELVVNSECNSGAGGWAPSAYGGNAPDQYIAFVANTGAVKQTLTAVAAGTYTFQFKFRDDSWRIYKAAGLAGPQYPLAVTVQVGTTDNGTQLMAATKYTTVGTYSVTITVAAPTNVYLKFTPDNDQLVFPKLDIDDVTFRSNATATYKATPWTAADIPQVQFVNETGRDRMVFVHPKYEPYVLVRASTTAWLFQKMFTEYGGTIPLAPPGHTVAEWSASNWPSVVEVWQGRLWMAATPAKKNTFWASKPFSYDFTAANYNALNAGDGFSYDVAVKGEIRWMQGQKVMLAGADDGEYSISARDGVVYAGNVEIRQESAYGSAKMQAVAIGDQVLFVSQDRRKVRAMSFSLEGGGWYSKDITFTAEHLTAAGIVDLTFARDPNGTIVLALADGSLACCNYDRAEQVAGWWTATLTSQLVKSVSVVNTGGGDEVWAVVELASGIRYLMGLPFYETSRPKIDFQRTLTAIPAVTTGGGGTMAFTLSTMTVTASATQFQVGYPLACKGALLRIGSIGGPCFRVVSRVDNNHAIVEFTDYSDPPTGDVAATATWALLSEQVSYSQFTVGGGAVGDSGWLADGTPLLLLETATGIWRSGYYSGPYALVDAVDLETGPVTEEFIVGMPFTATAVTLPLEGGNPAGSAQGMKIHRPGATLRLYNSGLPLVNGVTPDPESRQIGALYGSSFYRNEMQTFYTEDVTAAVLDYSNGGVLTISQDLPIRTEVCALFGAVQMGKV